MTNREPWRVSTKNGLDSAPQVVEDQVTYPINTQMLTVPFARVVRGYSFFGFSLVYVIFEDGTDLYWARSRVLEYLNSLVSGTRCDSRRQLIDEQ